MIFYDAQSTDRTRDILNANPKCVCRDYPGKVGVRDDDFRDFANERRHEADGNADWAIWIDCDELYYHPQMMLLLQTYLDTGVEVPLIEGCAMFSKSFPTTDGQIYDEIKTGLPAPEWSKPCVFQPKAKFTWSYGRHILDQDCHPTRSPTVEIKLLHYRYLGLDYILNRNRSNSGRTPPECLIQTFGWNNNPEAEGRYTYKWCIDLLKGEIPTIL